MITFTKFMQHMFLEADAAGAAPAGGAAAGATPPAGGAAPAGGDLGGLGGAGAAPAGGDLGGLGGAGGADLGGGLGGTASTSAPAPKIKLFDVWKMLQDEKDEAEGKKEPEKEV